MKTAILALLFFIGSVIHGAAAWAYNDMRGVKISSCRENACTRLNTKALFRSTLQPGVMAFQSASMDLMTAPGGRADGKIVSHFEAESGYIDMQEQTIVLRGLKNSPHHELVYSLTDGKFIFF